MRKMKLERVPSYEYVRAKRKPHIIIQPGQVTIRTMGMALDNSMVMIPATHKILDALELAAFMEAK